MSSVRLLVYEHACGGVVAVLDTAYVLDDQPPLLGEVPSGYLPEDYAPVDPKAFRCSHCKHLEADARCKTKLVEVLSETDIAGLPTKLREAERTAEYLREEKHSLEWDLDHKEDEIEESSHLQAAADSALQAAEYLVKDIELYLSQIANRRTQADAGKHIEFLRDLALNARKRVGEAGSVAASA